MSSDQQRALNSPTLQNSMSWPLLSARRPPWALELIRKGMKIRASAAHTAGSSSRTRIRARRCTKRKSARSGHQS